MNKKMDNGEGLERVYHKAGELLFKEGDSSRHFYIVQKGQIEVFRLGAKGEEIPLAVIDEGQSLGEFAMIDSSPRSASARCLTDVEAVLVQEEAYRYMLQKLPDWALSMMQGLISRIRETNEILKRHGVVDPKLTQKIASMEFDLETSSPILLEFDENEKDEDEK
ncbi:MAG: cyclic nucleotide-binding domain-containing protein [Bdellovibrionales bacterium]|nr:cyclic nucleotide-binding domain-containing protein [Bdellovibrionales bacterium]